MKNIAIIAMVILMSSIFFAGCSSEEMPTPEPIRADINSDGSTEFVYLEVDESRVVDYLYCWNLTARKGYGESHLSEPIVLMSFDYKPEDIRIEDYNGDGVNDVVYLMIDKTTTDKDNHYVWHLMVAYGAQNYRFANPQIIATFESRPVSA